MTTFRLTPLFALSPLLGRPLLKICRSVSVPKGSLRSLRALRSLFWAAPSLKDIFWTSPNAAPFGRLHFALSFRPKTLLPAVNRPESGVRPSSLWTGRLVNGLSVTFRQVFSRSRASPKVHRRSHSFAVFTPGDTAFSCISSHYGPSDLRSNGLSERLVVSRSVV